MQVFKNIHCDYMGNDEQLPHAYTTHLCLRHTSLYVASLPKLCKGPLQKVLVFLLRFFQYV